MPSPMPPEVRFGRLGVPNPCHSPALPPDTMTPAERGDPETMNRALRVCRRCPLEIKQQCFDWVMSNQLAGVEVEGVYGETNLKQRRKLAKPKAKAKAPRITFGALALAA